MKKKKALGVLIAVGLCAGCVHYPSSSRSESLNDIPSGSGWVVSAVIYTFNADGTCLARADQWEVKGRWFVEQGKFVAKWDHGFVDTYDLPCKEGVFHGVNQRGETLKLYK